MAGMAINVPYYSPFVLLGDVDDVAVLHHVVRNVAPTQVIH